MDPQNAPKDPKLKRVMQPRLHPLKKRRLQIILERRRRRVDRHKAKILLRKHGGATIKFPLRPSQVLKGVFCSRKTRKNNPLLAA